PRRPSTSTEPVQNTLLDLQAKKVEITQGLAVVNDKAVPFNVRADNLAVEIHYIASTDRYGATIDLANLTTQIATEPDVQSKLQVTGELGRDIAKLTSLDFETGDKIHLTADALIEHFAKPEWEANATGSIDLKQLGYLAGVDGFYAGNADLELHGRNCVVSPQQAQKHPHFWQRHNHKRVPADAKMLPPTPECTAGYLLVGQVKAHRVTYRNPDVRVHDVDAAAELHVTPTEMLFTALTSTLPGGGRIEGALKIENWLGEVPSDAPAASATTVAMAKTANTAAKGLGAKAPVTSLQLAQPTHAHAFLTVKVKGISLRTIMEMTASENYGDLGYDTSINGPVDVEWGGPVTNIDDSVQVQANFTLVPTGLRSRGYPSNIPLRGNLVAHYNGANETVRISQLNFITPATTMTANGLLGVSDGDPLTNLKVNLQTRDLGEFNQLLETLDFEANGKKGTAAIPLVLHGTMDFSGYAKGAVENLDVKGHLIADNVEVKLGTQTDVLIDSVVADAEYSPNEGVAIAESTVKRGSAVLNVTGTFAPRRAVSQRGVVTYEWDGGMQLNANAKLADAQVIDVLQIAGVQQKVPLTGVMNMTVHAQGTVNNLGGSGN
ncbi:MAG: translocation/assembly module TamB, partial [Bryocella sp.]